MSSQLKQTITPQIQLLATTMMRRSQELRLGQSTASLSFISLLAMVPLLTVVFATLATFPVFTKFNEAIQLMLVQNLLPEGFALTIARYLNQFTTKAQTLSLFGIGFLVVTATMMMLTLDKTMNLIWRVKTPRPFLHRLLVYWFVLLLGPIFVGAGTALVILLAGGKRAMMSGFFGLGWWDLVNLGLTFSAFLLCYRWVPNVTVRWRDAAMGAAAGAGLSELARGLFIGYVSAVPTYQQIYGSLAAIPAMLVWTYISWWAFLAGGLLASCLPEMGLAIACISTLAHHNHDSKETAHES
jgi:membrane protein